MSNVVPLRGRIPQWTFAERVRKVRRDLGLTQQGMADELGVGLKAYSAWETGRTAPGNITTTAETLERISGVPRAWFLGWADNNAPGPEGPGGGSVHPLGLEPRTHWLIDGNGVRVRVMLPAKPLAPVIPLRRPVPLAPAARVA